MKVLAKVVLLGLVVYSACQRGRPGGIMPANINHEEIQRMARFAVTEIGDEYEFGRVISATQQVSFMMKIVNKYHLCNSNYMVLFMKIFSRIRMLAVHRYCWWV